MGDAQQQTQVAEAVLPPARAAVSRTAGRVRLDLVVHLVRREFQIRYRRSLLGGLWAVVQPLARLAVLGFLFTRVLPLGVPDYTAFLFVGLMGWLWFAGGVLAGTASPVERRELVLRPGLPRALVPVVAVLGTGLDYLAALPVLVLFLLVTDDVPLTAAFLPVLLVLQLALVLGLAFALSAVNVFVRDVRILVDVGLLLGFYLTPVFFTAEQVPPGLRVLLTLNPVAGLLEMQRDVVVEGVLPPVSQLAVSALVCGAACALGYALYRRLSPSFADEL